MKGATTFRRIGICGKGGEIRIRERHHIGTSNNEKLCTRARRDVPGSCGTSSGGCTGARRCGCDRGTFLWYIVAVRMLTTRPAKPAPVALPFNQGTIFIFGSRHDLLCLQQHVGVLCAAAIGAGEGIGRKGGQDHEEQKFALMDMLIKSNRKDARSQARMATKNRGIKLFPMLFGSVGDKMDLFKFCGLYARVFIQQILGST